MAAIVAREISNIALVMEQAKPIMVLHTVIESRAFLLLLRLAVLCFHVLPLQLPHLPEDPRWRGCSNVGTKIRKAGERAMKAAYTQTNCTQNNHMGRPKPNLCREAVG